MLLNAELSSLLVVDIQERLSPAIHNSQQVIDRTKILLQASKELNVSVFVSEQYPKGLGHTVATLDDYMEAAKAEVIEKIDFSCHREKNIRDALANDPRRKQLVICGAEAHVCVLQTAIEFQQAGYDVFLVTDAVSSRVAENVRMACERMQQAGVTLVTSEMVVFEWMGKAGTDSFRTVSALIK